MVVRPFHSLTVAHATFCVTPQGEVFSRRALSCPSRPRTTSLNPSRSSCHPRVVLEFALRSSSSPTTPPAPACPHHDLTLFLALLRNHGCRLGSPSEKTGRDRESAKATHPPGGGTRWPSPSGE